MAKKFRLSTLNPERAVVVTVDDEDAYLLRAERWFAKHNSRSGRIEISRNHNGVTIMLGRRLLNIQDNDVCVVHKNNDATDFRRNNLIALTRSELSKITAVVSRGLHSGVCNRGHVLTSNDINPNGGGNGHRTCRACDKLREVRSSAARRARASSTMKAETLSKAA